MKNKRMLISIIVAALALVGLLMAATRAWARTDVAQALAPAATAAVVSNTISYQGRLLDSGGNPVEGAQVLTFRLYTDAHNGTLLWSQTGSVPVNDGLFTAYLDVNPLLFDGQALWLGVQVQGDAQELSPRQPLLPAPYAFYALRARWAGLMDVPPDLNDGDDNTTYTPGLGLTLDGTEFAISTTYRLPQGCGDSQIAEWDATSRVWYCGSDDVGGGSAAWLLSGNTGTTYGADVLGTTDAVSLTLVVSDRIALRLEPTAGTSNLIGGHNANRTAAGANGATIGGGGSNGADANRVTDHYGAVGGGAGNRAGNDDGDAGNAVYATVGGGYVNIAGGPNSTVSGGWGNVANNWHTTVGGGLANTASGDKATIGGGHNNVASGFLATIGGGYTNTASNSDTTIGGGVGNTAGGYRATIGGGANNLVTATYGTIAGGCNGTVTGDYAAVGGGWDNTAGGNLATVAGGDSNNASGDHATIGGGEENRVLAPHGAIAGGGNITVTGDYAYVGGGYHNTASGYAATIGGGFLNVANGDEATVCGGWSNTAGAWDTVGGGEANVASGGDSTIGGGLNNVVSGTYGTIAGGFNGIAGNYAAVGGGGGNTASGDYATVGGGGGNTASSWDATVGGGTSNEASANHATVGGGYDNTASNNAATVPGGASNVASGAYSFAAGAQAQATHQGAFVWSSAESASSWGDNTFTARAHGGARFYSASGITTGVQLSSGGTSWASISDRNAKENFHAVDGERLLETLAAMPIQTWNLRSQAPEMRHIGPVAQDFNGQFAYLFGEVESPIHINTMDAVGISLAAAQGLYAQNQEQAARSAALETENAALQQRVDDLEARMAAIEAAVGNTAPARPLQSNLLPGVGLALVGLAGLVWWRRKGGAS